MRFMMLMIPKGYEQAKAGALPPPEAVEAMMGYNEALRKAGVLVSAEGLHPPSDGVRLVKSGGKLTVVEGPFADTNETVGGYWLLQVKTKAEAVEWASRCPAFHALAPDGAATVELRQLQELGDWPEDVRAVLDKFPELQQMQQRA